MLKKTKITICHVPQGNPSNAHTISVSSSALDAHLNHGDYAGQCTSSNQDQLKNKSSSNNARVPSKKATIICHNPSGNPKTANTMTIFSYQLASHLDHRDSIGACQTKIERQDNKVNQYSNSANTSSDRKVIICHIPPDYPQYARTLSISYSALPYHLSHGDQQDRCNPEILPPGITQGFFGANNSVEQNPFLKKIPNPKDNRVTICHTPIGNPENSNTITISRSALDVHLKIGDTLGACSFDGIEESENPNKTNVLCHFVPGKYNKEGIPRKQFGILFNSDTYQNIVIKNSKLDAHLKNNPYDYPGYCSAPNENFEKCTLAFSFWANYFEQKQYGNINTSYSISQYASTFSDYQVGDDTSLPDGFTPSENNKGTITHIPPGNPDNAHEITVSENALKGHEKHGDNVGEESHTDTSKSKGNSDNSKGKGKKSN